MVSLTACDIIKDFIYSDVANIIINYCGIEFNPFIDLNPQDYKIHDNPPFPISSMNDADIKDLINDDYYRYYYTKPIGLRMRLYVGLDVLEGIVFDEEIPEWIIIETGLVKKIFMITGREFLFKPFLLVGYIARLSFITIVFSQEVKGTLIAGMFTNPTYTCIGGAYDEIKMKIEYNDKKDIIVYNNGCAWFESSCPYDDDYFKRLHKCRLVSILHKNNITIKRYNPICDL